jgi:hypothetical protein
MQRAGMLFIVAACAALLPGCGTATPLYAAACAGTLAASSTGPVSDPALVEISGMVASRDQTGIRWVHNDSGDAARIFAIGDDGTTRAEFTLTGALNVDWEDIALGPGPDAGTDYLYIADTGDNALTRTEVQVYRVPEPVVPAGGGVHELGGAEMLRLRFPDGAKNVEGLLVDPRNGQLTLVRKRAIGGNANLYRAPGNLAGGSLTTLTKVGMVALPDGWASAVTAIDMSADARVIALRTYANVRVYKVGTGKSVNAALGTTPCIANAEVEPQGEAVAIDPDSLGFVTISEGAGRPLHHRDA